MAKKQLKVWVEAEVIKVSKARAAASGMTLSCYVGHVLPNPFEEPVEALRWAVTQKKEPKREVRFLLDQSMHETLEAQAAQHRWPLTREIRWRLVATLSQKPKLRESEITDLNLLRHAVSRVGINLNTILKTGRIDMNTFAEDVMELKKLIKQTLNRVDSLREDVTDRWQFQTSSSLTQCGDESD